MDELIGIIIIRKRRWMKGKVGLAVALTFLLTAAVFALPMGPRQIADFEREALGVLKFLTCHQMRQEGDRAVVTLRDEVVKGFRVKFGEVEFSGLTPAIIDSLAAGTADFDEVRKIRAIKVRADLGADHLQSFINREVEKARGGRRIFEAVRTHFAQGQVDVSGLVHLDRIPGNPLAFIPQSGSPFSATIKLGVEGSQIAIDVVEAQVNQQPMTPELHAQVLSWLNPIWDFTQMPYAAQLEKLEISPAGISASGWLFAP